MVQCARVKEKKKNDPLLTIADNNYPDWRSARGNGASGRKTNLLCR